MPERTPEELRAEIERLEVAQHERQGKHRQLEEMRTALVAITAVAYVVMDTGKGIELVPVSTEGKSRIGSATVRISPAGVISILHNLSDDNFVTIFLEVGGQAAYYLEMPNQSGKRQVMAFRERAAAEEKVHSLSDRYKSE